jgi:hypothetical protein
MIGIFEEASDIGCTSADLHCLCVTGLFNYSKPRDCVGAACTESPDVWSALELMRIRYALVRATKIILTGGFHSMTITLSVAGVLPVSQAATAGAAKTTPSHETSAILATVGVISSVRTS